MIGFTTVRIVGPSMEPALRNGEVYLAVTGTRVEVGDVVVCQHPNRPDLLTVKRITRRVGEGWWLEGDRSDASSDSREFGPVAADGVRAKLLVRLRPLLRASPLPR